jgi:hypothetical protein
MRFDGFRAIEGTLVHICWMVAWNRDTPTTRPGYPESSEKFLLF